MSTRSTIKNDRDDATGDGFHLYSDVLDNYEGDGDIAPVYLELHGVQFDADSTGRVCVTIPREWAIKLGLLP